MYYCRGSTPQIGSSSSIILSGHLLLPFLYGAVQHCTVPHLFPPVRKSSPCIFISNRSRLHHHQPVSLFQSSSSSFSLPQPPRISPPLLHISFSFFFFLVFLYHFPFSFLFSYFPSSPACPKQQLALIRCWPVLRLTRTGASLPWPSTTPSEVGPYSDEPVPPETRATPPVPD